MVTLTKEPNEYKEAYLKLVLRVGFHAWMGGMEVEVMEVEVMEVE